MEYFGVLNLLFIHSVLISFRRYNGILMLCCAVFLPIGFGDFQNLCFPFPPPKLCFPSKPKEISFLIESQDSPMLYCMDEVISKKKELKKQALIFNFMCPPLTHDVSYSDDPRIPSKEYALVARGVGRHYYMKLVPQRYAEQGTLF